MFKKMRQVVRKLQRSRLYLFCENIHIEILADILESKVNQNDVKLINFAFTLTKYQIISNTYVYIVNYSSLRKKNNKSTMDCYLSTPLSMVQTAQIYLRIFSSEDLAQFWRLSGPFKPVESYTNNFEFGDLFFYFSKFLH